MGQLPLIRSISSPLQVTAPSRSSAPTVPGSASAQPVSAPASVDAVSQVQSGDLSQLDDAQVQIILQNRMAELQRAVVSTLMPRTSSASFQSSQTESTPPPASTVDAQA